MCTHATSQLLASVTMRLTSVKLFSHTCAQHQARFVSTCCTASLAIHSLCCLSTSPEQIEGSFDWAFFQAPEEPACLLVDRQSVSHPAFPPARVTPPDDVTITGPKRPNSAGTCCDLSSEGWQLSQERCQGIESSDVALPGLAKRQACRGARLPNNPVASRGCTTR